MNPAKIKSIRKKLGISQVEFALLMGVHPITVSKWDRGHTSPTPWQQSLMLAFRVPGELENGEVSQMLVDVGPIETICDLLKYNLPRR